MTFEKKTQIGTILGVFLGIIALLYPSFIYAATIFEDDFEDYEYGTLSGQHDWTGGNADVVSDETHTGTHSVYFGTYVSPVSKIGTEIDEGFQTFWFFLDTTPSVDGTANWSNSTSWQIYFKWDDCSETQCMFFYYNSEIVSWVEYGLINTGEWHSIQVQWIIDGSQFLWSFSLDFLGWSDFLETQTQSVKTIDRITITASDFGNFWIDDIKESIACELGTCNACDIWNECENAGCWWNFTPELGFVCFEPYETGEEVCGSYYKCKFCNTLETCEADETDSCEWKNLGYGFQCYMKTQTMPPEQAGWEEPELEECGELSGVEKWLCEIKNFIAGVFMPSQAKLDNLYQTFGNFKIKFPFNYISALQGFFSDIKTGIDEEKSIPIKILGTESNVDLSFWNNTATIGGESETFGNIIKDATSVLVLFCWFIWLISFIKRFFP